MGGHAPKPTSGQRSTESALELNIRLARRRRTDKHVQDGRVMLPGYDTFSTVTRARDFPALRF